MIEEIIEIDGVKWRVKAKSMEAALDEITIARCTGSVGSSSMLDETAMGGKITLLAEVHKLDDLGNDVVPS